MRNVIQIVMGLMTLGFAVVILVWVSNFNQAGVTPVVGPAGYRNRAYIENRSFGDISFVLCASDWPHTFTEPVSVDSVNPSEGSNSRVFWSLDGSVLAVKDGSLFTAAYDYQLHMMLYYKSDEIRILIGSRGGLGSEIANYPDEKASY